MATKWVSTRARIKMRRLLTEVDSGVRPAMQDSVNELHKDAIMNLPRNTGNLEDLITAYVSKNGTVGEVGLRGKKARAQGFYLRFLEFGTKGHKVSVGKGKKVLSNGDNTFGTSADIPAMPARPVLQPAWDRNEQKIRNRFSKLKDKAIQKVQAL